MLLARETGLEPATSGVTGRRSNQLSYSRSKEAAFRLGWRWRQGGFARFGLRALSGLVIVRPCMRPHQEFSMVRNPIIVSAEWDPEASVYVATSDDVPGLVAEAPTPEALRPKLHAPIPELLALNSVELGAAPHEGRPTARKLPIRPARQG